MIAAAAALRLARAQLSAAQRAAVAEALEEIEKAIHMEMERRGCRYLLKNTDGNVFTEVIVRLRAAGWAPAGEPAFEKGLDGRPRVIGYHARSG